MIDFLDDKHGLVETEYDKKIGDFKRIGDNKRVFKKLNFVCDAVVKDKVRNIYYILKAENFKEVLGILGILLLYNKLGINITARSIIFIVENPDYLLYTYEEKGAATRFKEVSIKDVLNQVKVIISFFEERVGREISIFHVNNDVVRLV